MPQGLSESRREALGALCDTIVPRIERDVDPDGFWARTATDLRIDAATAEYLLGIPDPEARSGMLELLDAFAAAGLPATDEQPAREAIVIAVAGSSPEAAYGVGSLIALVLYLYYGAADKKGANPNWAPFGYPGPQGPPPATEKRLDLTVPEGESMTLDADACVIGSGAGGGVIAASLAAAGLDVVVLEAGGYFNEADFAQLELKAHREMYWRGGPTPTADGNVSLQAGTTLGGGTTINWTNCLRTRPSVREQWAREHGLEDVGGPEFDRRLDAVLERLDANQECSDPNGPQQRMREGCEELGWSVETIVRNADRDRYEPESAGYMGFGDGSGAKLSGEKTFLADAQAEGARMIANCRAQRVLTEDGRATGVEAVYTGPDGTAAVPVRVRAGQVVVACGSLESPALLLRSGIGGPAVGSRLHIHPCTAVFASYTEDQRAWWGPPQALLCDEFAELTDGYGFLVETAQYAPGIAGSAVPWTSGEEHKEFMSRFANGATFIALTRDRGHGRVEVDPNGEAAPFYEIADEVDLANLRTGLDAQIRIHEAAGAEEIYALAGGLPGWRRGDDLDAFISIAQSVPFRLGGHKLFSAHQMGSCPMGADPETSVANRWGELHDTRGVWVGDASAFPTSSGTNPMITIMALARRTAEAIVSAG
jgi:choline dehydrogenase-like flavoprotein